MVNKKTVKAKYFFTAHSIEHFSSMSYIDMGTGKGIAGCIPNPTY